MIDSRWWARLHIALLAGGAWVGFAGWYLKFGLLVLSAAILAVAALYSFLQLLAAVSDDPALSEAERAKLRGRLLLFGPAAALELCFGGNSRAGGRH